VRITWLHIQNFRSVKDLSIDLGETTVLIGQNNAGKTAIIDAVCIVLTRRWGQRGTGFTENDVHRSDPDCDPRTQPPVTITLTMEEGEPNEWDADMVAALRTAAGINELNKARVWTDFRGSASLTPIQLFLQMSVPISSLSMLTASATL